MRGSRKPEPGTRHRRKLTKSRRFETLEERLALSAAPLLELHVAAEQALVAPLDAQPIDHHHTNVVAPAEAAADSSAMPISHHSVSIEVSPPLNDGEQIFHHTDVATGEINHHDGGLAELHDHDHDHDHDHGDGFLDHGYPLPDFSDAGLDGGDGGAPSGANVPLSQIPVLHSNEGAAATIYLDFNGHFETTWGAYSNITTPVYSSDADATTFSTSEIASITEVWKRVSEDFSPFNIDVTTVDPGDFSNGNALRVAIGGNSSWTGGNYGGVAYPNSFTNFIVNTVYVFADNLGDYARYIAEATSHEVGHGLGLYHQSQYDSNGTKIREYHPGNFDWAPIMGVSYSATQSLWSDGKNSYGSVQDDLSIITNNLNGFGYRADDHSNSLSLGTALTIANGQVSGSGIIEQMSDWDAFSLQINGDGQVSIDVSVADVGANLDARLDLYDSNEQLIVTADPSNSLSASINQSLSAGQYTLVVRSSGDYGELGQYTISGTVPTNFAPQLDPINDQNLGLSGSVVIQLSSTDVENDPVAYSVQAAQVDSTSQLAYQLDQQHGFYAAASEYLNLRGAGEKYLQGGNGDWYFMLADGRLYQWGTSIADSTLVATLDSSYYADLSQVHSPNGVNSTPMNNAVNLVGNTLTVTAPDGFTGDFTVTVTASDGMGSDTETFNVSVVNNAPVLATIGNQTMAPSQDTLVLSLSANDLDGDAVSFTAQATTTDPIAQAAYQADQQHNFQAAAGEYYNLRGAGEKYLQDSGGNWFFVLANGRLYQWGSSIADSSLVATLDSSYHADLSKLYNVQAPQSSGNVSVSINGNQLTIDPADGSTGDFTVNVTATDGVETDSETFTVSVVNHAPVLTSIGNQSMAPSQDTLILSLSANDVDGDSVSYTAQANQSDPIAQAAYNADQQHNFQAAASEYYNLRGAGEKYLQGSGGNWYFILADGKLYQWGSSIADSTLVATLNSSYYADLSNLFNVAVPQQGGGNVTLAVNGNQLTIDPADGFTGDFTVQVTATDGTASDSETFTVSVVNHAPVLSSIGNQSMSPNQDTLVLSLSANDSDGDSIGYSVVVQQTDAVAQAAYDADQQHNFQAAASEYYNLRSAGEKYLQDSGGTWYFILANGRLYQWGSSVADSTLIATLDSSYHADLTKLFDVAAPQQSNNVTATLDGNQLTIDPVDGFLGDFTVTVTATDGSLSDSEAFTVSVANQAPVLSTINDQVMTGGQDTLVISLSANDGDGDSISITAQAIQSDPIAEAAYQADQQHNFSTAGSEYYNYRGAGEKYFVGNGGAWYFILADGRLYQWGTSIADSTLLTTLDSSYHANLSTLYNVQAPQQIAANATLSINGNQLTIDPADGFSGVFTVNVSATDGTASDTESFTVTVPSAAPTFGMTAGSRAPMASGPHAAAIPVFASVGTIDSHQLSHQHERQATTPTLHVRLVDTAFESWEADRIASRSRLTPVADNTAGLRVRGIDTPAQPDESEERLAIESVFDEFEGSVSLKAELTTR